MRLQDWAEENWLNTDALDRYNYKEAALAQFSFVRDYCRPLFGVGLSFEQKLNVANVISTHHSKSITLPVYELTRPDIDLKIILRNNFYNWKMSVINSSEINANFSGLFHTSPPIDEAYTGNPLSPIYFEGFESDLIFSYYEKDNKRFSAEIFSNYSLYTTIFLIMQGVGVVKALEWATRGK